jgi:hypothetical protein
VKTWAKIIALGFTFLVGIGVGLGAYRLHVLEKSLSEGKERWLVCRFHQLALYDRADQFRQKYGRWPTNVQELVETHFLPEYSEVHFCPSQIGTLVRMDYDGLAWVDQNHTGLVAYYTSSPYRFQIESNNFTVICTFDKTHTQ